MRTMTRSTRLASILLPAFLYLGCTGEGITGPTAVEPEPEPAGAEPVGGAAAADHCVYWDEEMFCPSTGNPGGNAEAK